MSGPPEDAAWDPAQENWVTRIPDTDVLARYIVFTGAYPPAIVFRRFSR